MVLGSHVYRNVPSSESFDNEGHNPIDTGEAGRSLLGLRNLGKSNKILSLHFVLLSHIATSTFYLLVISTLWHQSVSLENCVPKLSTWCGYTSFRKHEL
jgi:hypothetical protein